MEQPLRDHFGVAAACEDIRRFNKSVTYPASDYLVGNAFAPYEALPRGQSLCGMILVNSLWNTSLRWHPDDCEVLSEEYEHHREELYQQTLERIRPLRLHEEPDRVWELGAAMLRPLLESDRVKTRHYSFATKFLHWHAPRHLPIMDSRTRKAIHSLQEEWGETEGLIRSDLANVPAESYVKEYRDWVRFYGRLLRCLTPDDRERLKATDADSLPKPFHRDDTLLRILDKVFYIRGREESNKGRGFSRMNADGMTRQVE